jgi:hypothetical protein
VTTLAELAIEIALSYDGVREIGGNNRGPQVEAFQRSLGLSPGDPWCAAFVCFCIKSAAKRLGVLPRFQYGGSVNKLWIRNPDLQMAQPVYNGLFLIDHGLSKLGTRIGHTGFCIGPFQANNDSLETMEGNTNAAGSRDGDGCYHKSREAAEMARGYGYLRIE